MMPNDVAEGALNIPPTGAPRNVLRSLIHAYERLLITCAALLPALPIIALMIYPWPVAKWAAFGFHEVAIGVSIMLGAFVSVVTWLCYRDSGEPLLYWMAAALLSFTVIYAPHGIFTSASHDHLALFLLYGPVSRLTMAAGLLTGLCYYNTAPHPRARRLRLWPWGVWIVGFLGLNLIVAGLAFSPLAAKPALRLSLEGTAGLLSFISLMMMIARRFTSPLMTFYLIGVACFVQSSIAFMATTVWTPLWWFAHAVFAVGFFLISYGVARAYLTTRSFSSVYSQELLLDRLSTAMAQTEDALRKLRNANSELVRMASTDPLTGASNRRHFTTRLSAELGKRRDPAAPLCLLSLDIDHFKMINDRFGHAAGDAVLKAVTQVCQTVLRDNDIVARVGGEEFMVMLAGALPSEAREVAERLREAVEALRVPIEGGGKVQVTVSVGLARCGEDGVSSDALFRIADRRLYDAKRQGRNRVVFA